MLEIQFPRKKFEQSNIFILSLAYNTVSPFKDQSFIDHIAIKQFTIGYHIIIFLNLPLLSGIYPLPANTELV